jgi:hypothetical protein
MIEKLKKEIIEIEQQAGELSIDDKEALYDLLVVAFFKAKDLIALLEAEKTQEVPEVSEEELSSLRATVASLQGDNKDLKESITNISHELQSCMELFKERKTKAVSITREMLKSMQDL